MFLCISMEMVAPVAAETIVTTGICGQNTNGLLSSTTRARAGSVGGGAVCPGGRGLGSAGVGPHRPARHPYSRFAQQCLMRPSQTVASHLK